MSGNTKMDDRSRMYIGRREVIITYISASSAFKDDKWILNRRVIADVYKWRNDSWYRLRDIRFLDSVPEGMPQDLPIIFECNIEFTDDPQVVEIGIDKAEADRRANLAAKSTGNQVFSVPNTPDGRAFLERAAQWLNRDKYIYRNRTRGARDGMPMDDCNWIAMYIKSRNEQVQELPVSHTVESLRRRNAVQVDMIEAYERQVDTLRDKLEAVKQQRNELLNILDDLRSAFRKVIG